MSRRAITGATIGVRWAKFNCTHYFNDAYYAETGDVATGAERVGTASGTLYVATTYSFDPVTGLYTLGEKQNIPGDQVSGTYSSGGTMLYYIGELLRIKGGIFYYYADRQRGSTQYAGWSTYTVGSFVRTVFAKDGTYPDSKYGYTYVGTTYYNNKTYTVMLDGSTYYAYILEEEL